MASLPIFYDLIRQFAEINKTVKDTVEALSKTHLPLPYLLSVMLTLFPLGGESWLSQATMASNIYSVNQGFRHRHMI